MFELFINNEIMVWLLVLNLLIEGFLILELLKCIEEILFIILFRVSLLGFFNLNLMMMIFIFLEFVEVIFLILLIFIIVFLILLVILFFMILALVLG